MYSICAVPVSLAANPSPILVKSVVIEPRRIALEPKPTMLLERQVQVIHNETEFRSLSKLWLRIKGPKYGGLRGGRGHD